MFESKDILDFPEEKPHPPPLLRRVERITVAVFLIAYLIHVFHFILVDLIAVISLLVIFVCYLPLGSFLFNRIALKDVLLKKVNLFEEYNSWDLVIGFIAGLNLSVIVAAVMAYQQGWKLYPVLMTAGLGGCSLILFLVAFLHWRQRKLVYAEILQRIIYWLFLGAVLYMKQ